MRWRPGCPCCAPLLDSQYPVGVALSGLLTSPDIDISLAPAETDPAQPGPNFVDPTATIDPAVGSIGRGSSIGACAFVSAGAVIGPCATIGDNVIVGIGAVISDHASVGAGTVVADGAWVGSGAVISPACSVGAGALVGRDSVLEQRYSGSDRANPALRSRCAAEPPMIRLSRWLILTLVPIASSFSCSSSDDADKPAADWAADTWVRWVPDALQRGAAFQPLPSATWRVVPDDRMSYAITLLERTPYVVLTRAEAATMATPAPESPTTATPVLLRGLVYEGEARGPDTLEVLTFGRMVTVRFDGDREGEMPRQKRVAVLAWLPLEPAEVFTEPLVTMIGGVIPP